MIYSEKRQREKISQGDLLAVGESGDQIEIPPIEGLSFSEDGFFAGDGDFISVTETDQIPAVYLRPMLVGDKGRVMVRGEADKVINVKSTIAMGKAACIEYPTEVDGDRYNFIQWKGIGENQANENTQKRALLDGGKLSFLPGEKGAMPFFILEIKGKILVRFMGAAFFEDLLLEADRSKLMEQYGLRIPKMVSTIKFSKDFCEKNNLPMPANDNPEDATGPSLMQFVEANEDKIEPELYKRVMATYETGDYDSAILGQNIRLFRNVWRVNELEEAMREEDQEKRKQKISAILNVSKNIFAKEFEVEMDDDKFIKKFALLLGKQVAILLENSLVHGAMKNHKQDITLAGEICDFDGVYQLNADYFADNKNKPKWVTDANTRREWIKEQKQELYRQILLIGAHLKPIMEAVNQLGNYQDEQNVAGVFVAEIMSNISSGVRQELLKSIADSGVFQNIKNIAGKDRMTQENLSGYQTFFDSIVEKINNSENMGLEKEIGDV